MVASSPRGQTLPRLRRSGHAEPVTTENHGNSGPVPRALRTMAPTVVDRAFCDTLTETDREAQKQACFAGFPLSQNAQVDDTGANPTQVIGDSGELNLYRFRDAPTISPYLLPHGLHNSTLNFTRLKQLHRIIIFSYIKTCKDNCLVFKHEIHIYFVSLILYFDRSRSGSVPPRCRRDCV